MDGKHTAGPWTYIPPQPYDGDDEDLEGSFYTPGGIEGADGNPVCVFGTSDGSGCMFENPANPPLISAAPDLLTEAREICAILDRYRADSGEEPCFDHEAIGEEVARRHDSLTAAIAKAGALTPLEAA